ncbi:MAG TPA: hypothetical protein VFS96_03005 [Nitrolancea sp.]|nr:hypothetical protein [Nitrolancea sp.]
MAEPSSDYLSNVIGRHRGVIRPLQPRLTPRFGTELHPAPWSAATSWLDFARVDEESVHTIPEAAPFETERSSPSPVTSNIAGIAPAVDQPVVPSSAMDQPKASGKGPIQAAVTADSQTASHTRPAARRHPVPPEPVPVAQDRRDPSVSAPDRVREAAPADAFRQDGDLQHAGPYMGHAQSGFIAPEPSPSLAEIDRYEPEKEPSIAPAAPAVRQQPVFAFEAQQPETDRPLTRRVVPEREPAIQVTIGRIEVRAVIQPPTPRQRPTPPAPKVSLDDYLRARDGGKS